MPPKWIIAMSMTFVVCMLINGWIEMQYLGNANAGVLHTLFTGYQEIEFTNPIIAIGSFVSVAWTYIRLVFAVLTWDYAFFHDAWEIFRYIFMCISIGITVSLVLAVRGTSSG